MTRGWLIAALAIVLCAFPLVSARAESALRHALNSNVPSTNFDNVPLGDCIDFLRDVSSANIVVDWKTLNAAGVTRDTPINLRMKNLSLRQVLGIVLTQASTTDEVLTYYIGQGVIHVTTKIEADKHVYTIVYDVHDLLYTVPDFRMADAFGGGFSTEGYGSQAGYGAGYNPGAQTYGAGNQGGYGSPGYGQSPAVTSSGQNGNGLAYSTSNSAGSGIPQTLMEKQAHVLIKLIETVIQPDAWRDNNGNTASIAEWNGLLIVTAPRSIQEAIGGPID